MADILIDIFSSYIRYALIGITTYLVGHHIVTAPQGDALNTELTKHLLLLLPAALTVVWGTLKAIWDKRARLTALMMPKGSTMDDLRAQIKTGVTPTVFTPSNTAPGVPLT